MILNRLSNTLRQVHNYCPTEVYLTLWELYQAIARQVVVEVKVGVYKMGLDARV